MALDRVVLVTGAARGIGAAIAGRFADDGARVVAADLSLPSDDEADGRLRYEQVDVSDEASVASLFERVRADLGRLDVLVNNAGIWNRQPFRQITVEEWDRVIGVNLRGTFLCTHFALDLLEADGGGVIINIGSQAGLTVTRGQGAHYHATKAAISHLTKVLAFELGPSGIRVNCVAPGMTPPDPSLIPQQMIDQIPLGRPGVPGDLAGACVFFASDDAAYVTGQTLLVNGGAVAFL